MLEVQQVTALMLAQRSSLGEDLQTFADGQCKQFLHKISIVTGVTVALVGEFTAALSSDLWNSEQRNAMLKAVNSRLLCDMASSSSSPQDARRRSNQRLCNFTDYLRSEEVNMLQSSELHVMTKLSLIAEFCWKLSLTLPDEPTVKAIVSTVLAASNSQELAASATYNLVCEFKGMIRNGKSKAKHLPALPVHIEHYPASPNDLPASLYTHVYAESPPVKISFSNLREVTSTVVLRKSSSSLKLPMSCPSGLPFHQQPSMPNQMAMPNQMMQTQHFMQNAFMTFLNSMARPPATPLTVFAPRRRDPLAIADAVAAGNAKQPEPSQDQNGLVVAQPTSMPTGATPPPPLFELPSVEGTTPVQHTKATEWKAAEQASVMKDALASKNKAKKEAKEAMTAAPTTKKGVKKDAQKKSKAKKVLTDTRPVFPKQQGVGAVHYNGGKVLRSDTLCCWRVFIRKEDRCDKRVPWNGSISKSWQQALDMIDES